MFPVLLRSIHYQTAAHQALITIDFKKFDSNGSFITKWEIEFSEHTRMALQITLLTWIARPRSRVYLLIQ
jgi:hypothetical protein